MARKAIEIVLDEKKRLEKECKKTKTVFAPFQAAYRADGMIKGSVGNNKSQHIKNMAKAAALLLCEIETIQAIKGDGIIQD